MCLQSRIQEILEGSVDAEREKELKRTMQALAESASELQALKEEYAEYKEIVLQQNTLLHQREALDRTAREEEYQDINRMQADLEFFQDKARQQQDAIAGLEEELARTREEWQHTVEELKATTRQAMMDKNHMHKERDQTVMQLKREIDDLKLELERSKTAGLYQTELAEERSKQAQQELELWQEKFRELEASGQSELQKQHSAHVHQLERERRMAPPL